MTEDVDSVWIRSEPTIDGSTYVVTLEVGQDSAITFDRQRATAYALGVLDAAHRAAYDAAVMQQMHKKLGIALEDGAQLVVDLRKDRPPLSSEATAPIALDPGVTARDQKPFLAISVHGKRVGQWTVDDAREHALAVLETVVAADLDANYFRALVGIVGIDAGRAQQAVADIANHREK